MNQKLLSIQEVSRELHVPKHTLRYWEKEFQGVLVPSRTEGGQRRYSPEDLEILGKIKLLKKEGRSIAEIRDALQCDSKIKIDHYDYQTINLLAKRIAEVLRDEIFSYSNKHETDHKHQEVRQP